MHNPNHQNKQRLILSALESNKLPVGIRPYNPKLSAVKPGMSSMSKLLIGQESRFTQKGGAVNRNQNGGNTESDISQDAAQFNGSYLKFSKGVTNNGLLQSFKK